MISVIRLLDYMAFILSLLILIKIFFAHLFCNFFNLEINDSIFPNVLQFSTVIPLHKSGVKTNICNYRPINQLNNVSKIFERLLFTQLYNHFEDNNLFYNFQFGFRKHRNSLNLTLLLINDIKSNKVDKRFSCCVFIDFTKAFDSVNIQILMNKLR